MIQVDARGLSCPEPVIMLKKAMLADGSIRLLVDNKTSSAICGRFAESKGFFVTSAYSDGVYTLEMHNTAYE